MLRDNQRTLCQPRPPGRCGGPRFHPKARANMIQEVFPYKVAEGDTLYIEKLNVEAGETVTFDKVLAVVDGDNAKFGAPSYRYSPQPLTLVISTLV